LNWNGEQHTKELEDRLSVLQKQSDETDEENNSLKELLERFARIGTLKLTSQHILTTLPHVATIDYNRRILD
jgi:tRNA pseudouridine-54 N-methylase